LVCISWQLSPSQRCTSLIPPISLCVCVCVCMCIHPIVARHRVGRHVPASTNTRNHRRIGGGVFYAVRVLSKESRRLVLPRTSPPHPVSVNL
jgi:hypothetical protein